MPELASMPTTRGRTLNHVAWLYDPLLERLSFGLERRFREQTLTHAPLAPGHHVLDVGCGTGTLTLLVARRLGPEGRVVGIDAAPKMIEIARRKAMARALPATFEVGLAEALAFPDRSFDLVINSMFLHHLDHELKLAALFEMRRVMKPGGILVTADIHTPRTLFATCLGWGGRYLLVQKELDDNLRGRLPGLMAGAGFVEVAELEQVFGLVSFFTARAPSP